MENHQNKYRFERKYLLNIEEYDFFLEKLKSNRFTIHHPSRTVNNIYLDSFSKDSFIENVEGENKRNKYRLRWYGNRFNEINAVFEVKIKRDNVNRKETIKIPKFQFNSVNRIPALSNHLLDFIKEKDQGLYVRLCNKLPVLLNGYSRDYFITEDGKTRLTIDRDIYYYNVSNQQEYNIKSSIVVEVKYATDTIPKINFEELGLVLSKNSKYVSGLSYTSF